MDYMFELLNHIIIKEHFLVEKLHLLIKTKEYLHLISFGQLTITIN